MKRADLERMGPSPCVRNVVDLTDGSDWRLGAALLTLLRSLDGRFGVSWDSRKK
ncbi:hypothetical protein [Nocardia sp. NBC_00416]|uniref:hypothetical protein n=1 Tax=Nocardia sp. NBC_00416 TaxID=2975991 RepID=UPI002E1EC7BD